MKRIRKWMFAAFLDGLKALPVDLGDVQQAVLVPSVPRTGPLLALKGPASPKGQPA